MTILWLKNLTNIYWIDAKKTRREARMPCSRRSTDQTKVFKVQYVDSWGRAKWGERKPEREEKEEEEAGRLGAGLKHHLGAIDLGAVLSANNHDTKLGAKIYGAKLDAKIYGTKVPAKSPPCLHRAQDLGAKIYGAETCNLGATNDGTELRVQILKAYL